MKYLSNIIPIISTLRNYNRQLFISDLIAGITVATVLIPQGMAYSLLAGMPPIYGLYAGLFPLLIYAIFGTSRQMSIGPVAVSALLVLSGVSAIAEPGSPEYISLVITAGLLIGLAQVASSFLRMGFLVNFISHPVIAGFTSAAAVIILASQLKDALGITMPRFEHTIEYFEYTFSHIGETNWITAIICLASILLIFMFKKINRNIPGALIVVIIGTIISYFFDLEGKGVEIIRKVPEGLPKVSVPNLGMEEMKSLIPVILTVSTIGIVESISIAKVLESKHKNYNINPNQELFALGISKFFSSFFQAIPTSGSFTRSAINSDSGAKTTIASIVTAVLIALALIVLTPLFFYIPKAILAAIILLAVFSLFDLKEAISLWKVHKRDFLMMLITFGATLIFGIEEGVLVGVILSVVAVLYKSSKPHIAVLGNLPETNYYRNICRFPEAIEPENTLIVRFDDQLYYANSVYFKDKVYNYLKEEDYRDIRFLVLDASNIHDIDSTGLHMLKDLDKDLDAKNIELHLCGVTGPVRDMLFKSNLMKEPEKHHMSIHDAIEELHLEVIPAKKHNSTQTNIKR